MAVTVGKEIAERIAKDARQFARLPAASQQHSILSFAEADIVGLIFLCPMPVLERMGIAHLVRAQYGL